MNLSLGEKLLDDFTLSDLLMGKERIGPLFDSHETDSAYILIAHLKGYYRESIIVEISEDATYIAIRAEKPVHETLMVVGWKVPRRDLTMRGYRKVFKVPDGVVFDKINARYNEAESTLTVSMAKRVKGVSGIEFEEVKEGEVQGGRFRTLQFTDEDGIAEREEECIGLEGGGENDQSGQAKPEKRPKMCTVPIMAGSALLVSVIVFVINLVRNKNKTRKQEHP